MTWFLGLLVPSKTHASYLPCLHDSSTQYLNLKSVFELAYIQEVPWSKLWLIGLLLEIRFFKKFLTLCEGDATPIFQFQVCRNNLAGWQSGWSLCLTWDGHFSLPPTSPCFSDILRSTNGQESLVAEFDTTVKIANPGFSIQHSVERGDYRVTFSGGHRILRGRAWKYCTPVNKGHHIWAISVIHFKVI